MKESTLNSDVNLEVQIYNSDGKCGISTQRHKWAFHKTWIQTLLDGLPSVQI